MTDSKSVTRNLQKKIDVIPLFNFAMAQVPGKLNTADGIFSHLETLTNQKLINKIIYIIQGVPTQTTEFNIESAGNAQKNQVLFHNDDAELPSEEK